MKNTLFLPLSFLYVLISSCSQSNNPDILAEVGSREVTSFDYARTYSQKLINTQLEDSDFERERHLDFLIRNKLFAEAAIRNKLTLDSIALRYIALDSIKFLRDELYVEKILHEPLIVSDSLIRVHYIWAYRECHLKHLFFQTQSEADSAYLQLVVDPSLFDSIATQIFNNETMSQSGGDLGWVKYHVLDPNLEKVGFGLGLDSISTPVQSSFGWHILKKLDEKNQIITDESEFQSLKKRIKLTIQQKHFQIQSDQFVNQLLLSKNIQMDDRLIQDVSTMLFQLTQLTQQDQPIQIENKHEVIQSLLTNLREVSHIPLAEYDGGTFSVQDYMDGILSIPPVQTNYSPRTTFYHALRNKILAEEGSKEGYGNHPNLKRKLQDTKDNFLSRAFLSTYFKGEHQGHFQKSKLDNIADSLRQIIKVKSFPNNLDKLFEQN